MSAPAIVMDGGVPWGPEQEQASRSRVRCTCGHYEMDHSVPHPDYPDRDCVPPAEFDWDLATGEEVLIDGGGCACNDFCPAPVQLETRA